MMTPETESLNHLKLLGKACFGILQAIIRAVCTLIDSFHFQVLPSIVEAAASPEPGQPPSAIERAADADVEIADEPEVAESTGHYGKEPDANSGREILGTLTRRVLPALQSALVTSCHLVPSVRHNLDLLQKHWLSQLMKTKALDT